MQSLVVLLISLCFNQFVLAQTAKPKNMAIVFGGNDGKNTKDENIFTSEIGSISKSLSANGWETQTLYDSEPEYFSKAQGISEKNVRTAKKSDLKAALDRAILKAQNGKCDQLLLVIDTHGDTDGTIGFADGFFRYDDPEITERLKKLTDARVRIGIITEACYGGLGVEALSKYGCVMSAQSSTAANSGGSVINVLNGLYKVPTKNKFSMSSVFPIILAGQKYHQNGATISGFKTGNDLSKNYTSFYSRASSQDYQEAASCHQDFNQSIEAISPLLSRYYEQTDYKTICGYFGQKRCLPPAELAVILKTQSAAIEKKNRQFDELANREHDLAEKCRISGVSLKNISNKDVNDLGKITKEIVKIQTEIDELEKNSMLGYRVNQAKAYAYLQEKRKPNLPEAQKAQMNRCDHFILKGSK